MPQTIAEKIFQTHIKDNINEDTCVLTLDRVFCHEITTPIAITDLISKNKDRVYNSENIKAVIDHITPAKDSKSAEQGKILRDWAKKHNIEFFDVGRNGVCHALFPEKGFIRPGFTAIMGDSHTCTYGAFGAFGAGVGTTDLEVGILKGICVFKKPDSIKVNITGKMPDQVYAKDVILEIIRVLTVNGATNTVIEFSGPIIDNFSMESRMTLSNMAVEAGATSGICRPDRTTAEYLWNFIKDDYSSIEDAVADFKKWWSDEDATYKNEINIDVTGLNPKTTFDYKPDQVKDLREMNNAPIDQVYIGSCTNGRIEDLRSAASILKGNKIADSVRGVLSPATPAIYNQALEEGIIKIFMDAGFCVVNPTCGACLGMSTGVLADGEVCASTTNRNFRGRMGKGGTVHLMSPASAAASAIKGQLTDPRDI